MWLRESETHPVGVHEVRDNLYTRYAENIRLQIIYAFGSRANEALESNPLRTYETKIRLSL